MSTASTINSKLAIEEVLKQVLPNGQYTEVKSVTDLVDADLILGRVISLFLCVCAFVSVVVLSIGIFGILSLEVERSTLTIGLLIALGARSQTICFWVLSQVRWPFCAGLSICLTVILLTKAELIYTFSLSSLDILVATACGVFVALFTICVSASVPIVRALRVSPAISLRSGA